MKVKKGPFSIKAATIAYHRAITSGKSKEEASADARAAGHAAGDAAEAAAAAVAELQDHEDHATKTKGDMKAPAAVAHTAATKLEAAVKAPAAMKALAP